MASNIEDFVKRLTRVGRQFTFIFTEDFFDIAGVNGVNTARFIDIRNTIKNVGHRKGLNAELHQREGTVMFDVNIMVIKKGFSSFMTTFDELNNEAFSDHAIIYGMGGDLVDAQKAKFQVDSFMSEKNDHLVSTTQLIADVRKRTLILVVESPADLKRPSLEPLMKLRSQLSKVLVCPQKGPVVDCQVSKVFQEGNSSSLSSLLNMFCVHYS
ncbi:MAG: hypothetical protein LBT89_11445 [Planctomycetaceae bacterium]|jgi:hypothetical protein|nr:hypothetical protein [Planctomycetaceae bacterium]